MNDSRRVVDLRLANTAITCLSIWCTFCGFMWGRQVYKDPAPSPETARAPIEFDQWRAIYTDFLRQGKSITEAADLTDEAMEVIGYHTPARED